jgi:hypothetical protein
MVRRKRSGRSLTNPNVRVTAAMRFGCLTRLISRTSCPRLKQVATPTRREASWTRRRRVTPRSHDPANARPVSDDRSARKQQPAATRPDVAKRKPASTMSDEQSDRQLSTGASPPTGPQLTIPATRIWRGGGSRFAWDRTPAPLGTRSS